MFFSSLDFEPAEKIRSVKIPKIKKLKVYFCSRCGAEAPRSRTICDPCLSIKKRPALKPERPIALPCIRCGAIIPVGGRGKATLCEPCKPLRIAEQKKLKYDTDDEFRRRRYDHNNQNAEKVRREAGGMTKAEWAAEQRHRAEEQKRVNPFKTCKICNETKERSKFKAGCTCKSCKSCSDKLKRQREKQPTHPKRVVMLEARTLREEQQEILKRFDLFAPEKAEARRLNKLKSRTKERSTPEGRLNRNISELVRLALKENKTGWRSSVGWTMPELKAHLEKHFRFGMTWENYGEWHLDHIKPRSLFSFSSPHDPQFKECWALSNLQPLWASENLSKNNTYPCPYHGNIMVLLS